MKDKYIAHLEWIYDRMKSVHNENENLDYMIKFREVIDSLRKSVIIKHNTVVFPKMQRCPKHRNK